MDVRFGLWRRLSTKELMLLNCGVGEDSWESLGLQGDPTSPFWRRSALGFPFFGRNDAEAETPGLWPPHVKSWLIGKDADTGLGAWGDGDDRGWDGWMASLTRWKWVWVNSGSWWWTVNIWDPNRDLIAFNIRVVQGAWHTYRSVDWRLVGPISSALKLEWPASYQQSCLSKLTISKIAVVATYWSS